MLQDTITDNVVLILVFLQLLLSSLCLKVNNGWQCSYNIFKGTKHCSHFQGWVKYPVYAKYLLSTVHNMNTQCMYNVYVIHDEYMCIYKTCTHWVQYAVYAEYLLSSVHKQWWKEMSRRIHSFIGERVNTIMT